MALPPPSNSKVTDYGTDPDSFTLSEHMQKLLDTVVGVYEQAGIPLPARRYWMSGLPSEDCEQVVVSLLQVYLGIPGDQASDIQKCNAPATAVVNVQVTRNYPIGNEARPASPEQIIEASKWTTTDSWLLFRAMQEFDKDDLGYPGPGAIATVTSRPPEGGVQTTVLNLSTMVM